VVSADAPHKLTVTLELDATSTPIRGVARDEHGAQRPFTGWVGLATVLERALELGASAAAGKPQESREAGS
jgi:hypothetical protein